MDQQIQACLSGRESTEHILPFFWQHGEDHDALRRELDAIERSGVREFCVESRPHPHFCEEEWWVDFGFLLREAKSRGMRVWLLDDKKFPTGYANYYIADHPELRMKLLCADYRDFAGPMAGASLLIPTVAGEEETLVAVVAYRRTVRGNLLTGEGINLTPYIADGLINWDIPAGAWRVYYLVQTVPDEKDPKRNYIDMLSPESCKAMLHAAYEPHYEHFAPYFGNTLAGFFSDEPSFGNEGGTYDSKLGKEGMRLPWCGMLISEIAARAGISEDEALLLLPGLWHEIEGRTSIVREPYMEAVTEAYRRNFCRMLGDWCREHGVLYIGHVIEDMNTHQRLGYGAGHFFRALDGQDMAGIDVVLHQIVPGFLSLEHRALVCGKVVDPEFFNYTLGKLGSSLAHIQPLKKNRAMCEIYGAFGWAEGVPFMKYLTDYMLTNGINYFVPHAFSPKFPDPDCPPHFNAGGSNPQFGLFAQLMRYTARLAHALSGGVHQADVAVYYNAEAEWSGGNYMLQQKVCKALTTRQLDFDLIPQDTLRFGASVQDGRLVVNEETYGALIVPYSQYLPEALLLRMETLAVEGLPVIFVDGYPDATSERRPIAGRLTHCATIPLARLADALTNAGLRSVTPAAQTPLRFYHIRRDGHDLYMLWNEDPANGFDTWVKLPVSGSAVFYDAWVNKLYRAQQRNDAVRVKLAPAQAILLCVDGETAESLPPFDYRDDAAEPLELNWRVSVCDKPNGAFEPLDAKVPGNLARRLPHFAGVVRCEAEWTEAQPEKIAAIDLGAVGEAATLWVNGECCGIAVGAPFRFCVAGKLHAGANMLRVDVYTNLAYRERDRFSTYLPLPPTGLLGPVTVVRRELTR